ncbi:helix-turn-helix transcriptional regulator [Mycobacterium sp.]|uniref:helix-turn-helix transcriptional regulator n=1 Tax=Mycobacterium sp. TaxID=1785 RepID=UPI003BB142A7
MKRERRSTRVVSDDLGTPEEVAVYLKTTETGLAQMRYRGTGPKFIKRGSRVLYRWSDVTAYLDGRTYERSGA